MIRNMIDRVILDKQNVTIYCQLGTERYAYLQGIISEYGVDNDSLRLICPRRHPNGTYVPLTAVHSIIASD